MGRCIIKAYNCAFREEEEEKKQRVVVIRVQHDEFIIWNSRPGVYVASERFIFLVVPGTI